MEKSKKIAVIGAGFMGAVIASIYARYGYNVALHDQIPSVLGSFHDRAFPIVQNLSNAENSVEDIFGNVIVESELDDAIDGAFLVHEIVQEDLRAKQELFALLDRRCESDVVLATNTSSFLLTDICRGVQRRQRVLGVHFVTPAHVVQAVELIYADFTPDALVEWGRKFLATINHVGVACRERPGFLVNRLQYALLAEVYRILDEHIASRDDVDTAVRLSIGPRLALWGPLLTEDLVVSKKTTLAVVEYLYQQTGDANFSPRSVLRELVDEGSVGAMCGKGWYKFSGDYPSVVKERDRQLLDLLSWLRQKDPVSTIGINTE